MPSSPPSHAQGVDGSVHSAYHPHLASGFRLPPLARLFDGDMSTLASRCTQRSLMSAANGSAWIAAKAAHDAFDAGNRGATVPHREAVRLVSCSQDGAGSWLARLPDHSLPHSVIASTAFLVTCQRRLGLYLSTLIPPLAELAARGGTVTQHELLGDAYINAANHTTRHNAALRASYTALSALSTATQPPGALKLGDKGDGSPATLAQRKAQYAHINAGHIPDIIRFCSPPTCFELKCFTPFHIGGALGHGSQAGGGAASTVDGHFIAMGNTEEAARALVFGLSERGDPNGPTFDRRTGVGWVRARAGQYSDAASKGHHTTLLALESTGAMATSFRMLLRVLGRQAVAPGTHDSTVYGTARSSPRSFYPHHVAAIASAVVAADANTILNAGAALLCTLTFGAHISAAAPSPLATAHMRA